MVRLLEALTEPPAADTVAVRTAAAAVEELCVLEMYSWGKGSGGDSGGGAGLGGWEAVRGRTHASVVGDPALQALPRGGLWGPGTRNQRFAAMLTDVYARSAGMRVMLLLLLVLTLLALYSVQIIHGGLVVAKQGRYTRRRKKN